MRSQNATKSKVTPALSRLNSRSYLPNLSPNNRKVFLKQEEKKGATLVLGINPSASSQCAPPTRVGGAHRQLTRHET
jgi:hypothetical protein